MAYYAKMPEWKGANVSVASTNDELYAQMRLAAAECKVDLKTSSAYTMFCKLSSGHTTYVSKVIDLDAPELLVVFYNVDLINSTLCGGRLMHVVVVLEVDVSDPANEKEGAKRKVAFDDQKKVYELDKRVVDKRVAAATASLVAASTALEGICKSMGDATTNLSAAAPAPQGPPGPAEHKVEAEITEDQWDAKDYADLVVQTLPASLARMQDDIAEQIGERKRAANVAAVRAEMAKLKLARADAPANPNT